MMPLYRREGDTSILLAAWLPEFEVPQTDSPLPPHPWLIMVCLPRLPLQLLGVFIFVFKVIKNVIFVYKEISEHLSGPYHPLIECPIGLL